MLTHERYVLGKGKRMAQALDAWDRYCGYESGGQARGLEPLVIAHSISGEIDVIEQFVNGSAAAWDALLTHSAKPTAVICYNDYEAYGLIRAAQAGERGNCRSGCRWSGTAIWRFRGLSRRR